MNERRKKNRTFWLFCLDLLILMMAWGGLYRCQLANSDTLWGQLRPDYTMDSRLMNFRWLAWVGDSFLYRVLHYYPYEHQKLTLAMFLVILALSMLLLQKIFLDLLRGSAARPVTGPGSRTGIHGSSSERKDSLLYGEEPMDNSSVWLEIGVIAACALPFVNVLFADYFCFTECFFNFGLGLLCAMGGCRLLTLKRYGSGALCLIAGAMLYQVFCLDAAIVLATYVLLTERGHFSLRLLRREILAIAFPAGAGAVDYAIGPAILSCIDARGGRDLTAAKVVEQHSLHDFLVNGAVQFRRLYESSLGLMIPVWLPLLFSLMMTAVVLVVLIRREKWNELGTYLLYKIVVFILMSGLQVLSSVNEFTGRIVSPFYVMQAMNAAAALYVLREAYLERIGLEGFCSGKARLEEPHPVMYGTEDDRSGRKIRRAGGVIILYLLAQVFFIEIIIANRGLSENLDMLYANTILDRVETYEKETGEKVTKAVFCTDTNVSLYYPQVQFTSGAINMRVYGTASYTLIETMAQRRGRHLELADTPENDALCEKLFGGKNWDSFDPEEQIVIEGDTLYGCAF